MSEQDVVISFDRVSKVYRLYKSDKQRLLGIFFKKIPYTKKCAVNDMSFQIHRGEAVAILPAQLRRLTA